MTAEGGLLRVARLLPWVGPDGKPCYLITDTEGGYLFRLADNVESIQRGMAEQLLGHPEELLDDPRAEVQELRYLTTCLSVALRDVHRVAESRGTRLPPSPDGQLG
ncbi:hypothetical protein AB0B50_32840 [Streptomyces sp. NPDC041068]|uniref:hypothetical protein n=1 Tax=Streptomyces sp. NPDC041068 TaxID=3155130 RepID=UPI0033C033A8